MESLLSGLTDDWLGPVSGWASILGLVLTVFVLWDLRRVRTMYLFNARAPKLIEQLGEHASKLIQLLNDFGRERDAIELELVATSVTLRSLEKKVRRSDRRLLRRVRSKITAYKLESAASSRLLGAFRQPDVGESGLRAIYVDLMKVLGEMREREADLRWEK